MRRLWHQLTNKLFEFFDHPLSRPYRVDVFNKFVRDFESKLNQLRLVEMGVTVSKEIDSEYRKFWSQSLPASHTVESRMCGRDPAMQDPHCHHCEKTIMRPYPCLVFLLCTSRERPDDGEVARRQ